MRTPLTILLLLAPGLALAAPVLEGGYAEASDPRQPTTAVYGTLVNPGPADRLISAEALDVAAVAHLHEGEPEAPTLVADHHTAGRWLMDQAEVPLDLPAGGSVRLGPERHVMLLGLSEPLVPGQSFDLVLAFASGARVIAEVRVVAPSQASR